MRFKSKEAEEEFYLIKRFCQDEAKRLRVIDPCYADLYSQTNFCLEFVSILYKHRRLLYHAWRDTSSQGPQEVVVKKVQDKLENITKKNYCFSQRSIMYFALKVGFVFFDDNFGFFVTNLGKRQFLYMNHERNNFNPFNNYYHGFNLDDIRKKLEVKQ